MIVCRSLEVAERSTAALDSIRGLAERQAEATTSLQSTVDSQLKAIRASIDSGSNTAQEALFRWKDVRRDKLVATRKNDLATTAINRLPLAVSSGCKWRKVGEQNQFYMWHSC